MQSVGIGNNFDIETFLNNASAQASRSDLEGKKVTTARIKTHTEKIADKRQERIDNLKDQMKGASGGGCLKFLKSIFKVFDLLLKPLSLLTGNQLKLELGKALEMLQKAKIQGKLAGLKIDGKEIQQVLQGIKKVLQDDIQRVEKQEELGQKQTQKILKMIEEIHEGFDSTLKT